MQYLSVLCSWSITVAAIQVITTILKLVNFIKNEITFFSDLNRQFSFNRSHGHGQPIHPKKKLFPMYVVSYFSPKRTFRQSSDERSGLSRLKNNVSEIL